MVKRGGSSSLDLDSRSTASAFAASADLALSVTVALNILIARTDRVKQPSLGVRPMAFDGALGDTDVFRHLLIGEADEKLEDDDLRFFWIFRLQLLQRVVDQKHFLV